MITVKATINSSLEKVWDFWINPEHIINWNFASPDWHTPFAENDLRVNGKFISTMASRDGKMSFDFEGQYTTIKNHSLIEYKIIDGRKVSITFKKQENLILVTQTFDPESENSLALQEQGWQAILDNFKKYVEENNL
jgi:uncharacterized protein YndB with AHSA1/START domain